jgi:UDP-N-acetyl-D-mannosaminuronic acid dehydrogenase/UDP-N-acetyl-D-glucosamine dehydrogenase
VERPSAVAGTREAETAKLLENTFRHVNIALVNELAIVARQLGVDLSEAIEAAATKPFGFMPFRPGPGVGGHCLPIDPTYLSWEARRTGGRPVRFVELANEVNTSMPGVRRQRLIETLSRRGAGLAGQRRF